MIPNIPYESAVNDDISFDCGTFLLPTIQSLLLFINYRLYAHLTDCIDISFSLALINPFLFNAFMSNFPLSWSMMLFCKISLRYIGIPWIVWIIVDLLSKCIICPSVLVLAIWSILFRCRGGFISFCPVRNFWTESSSIHSMLKWVALLCITKSTLFFVYLFVSSVHPFT